MTFNRADLSTAAIWIRKDTRVPEASILKVRDYHTPRTNNPRERDSRVGQVNRKAHLTNGVV